MDTTAINLDAFWSHIERGPACWPWRGPTNEKGYGRWKNRGRKYRVHRLAYVLLRGPIPPGLVIDHTCRVRNCCNPDHMEPVTNRTNILRGESPSAQAARQTHCKRRHQFTEDNTYLHRGIRHCRACRRFWRQQARDARLRRS